jgi:hypothetical protein
MKKVLIFILLILFTGLTAFSGQSVNGPGIRDFVLYEHEIPAAETVENMVPANGLTGVSPVIDFIVPIIKSAVPGPIYIIGVIPVYMADGVTEYAYNPSIFECITQANPDIRKGGALSFDGGMKPGM